MTTKYLVLAIMQAESGVDYDRKTGAFCPFCGYRLRVRDTMPWYGDCRVRYHKCINEKCYLNQIEKSIKSVEELR